MNSTKAVIRVVIGVIAILTLLFLVWYLRIIVLYLIISAAISLIGRPLIKQFDKIKIRKKPFPNALSAIITLIVIGCVFVGFFSLFAPLVSKQAQEIAKIHPKQIENSFQEPIADIINWLEKFQVVDDQEGLKNSLNNSFNEVISLARVSNIFEGLLGTIGNFFYAFLSIVFMSFYFLKDRMLLNRIIISIAPEDQLEKIKYVMEDAKKVLTRYFIGILFQVSIVTLLVFLGLSIVGVKNVLLIAFFAGIINIIPYIGPFIGAAFGIVFGLTSSLDLDFYTEMLPFALQILSVFLVVQLIDSFVLQPLIFSNSVNAHPLEIFVVIMVGATLAGISGMIVAVPVYSFMRIIAKEYFSKFQLVQSLTRKMED